MSFWKVYFTFFKFICVHLILVCFWSIFIYLVFSNFTIVYFHFHFQLKYCNIMFFYICSTYMLICWVYTCTVKQHYSFYCLKMMSKNRVSMFYLLNKSFLNHHFFKLHNNYLIPSKEKIHKNTTIPHNNANPSTTAAHNNANWMQTLHQSHNPLQPLASIMLHIQ